LDDGNTGPVALAEVAGAPAPRLGNLTSRQKDVLDQFNSVAHHHLDDEEQKVVPLAAVTLSQQERDALEKHTVAKIPRNKRPIAFGMVRDPLNETDREFMLRTLPRPVRMARGILIERPWKRYVTSLRAGS
jgi:hypothetical protein